MNREEAFRTLEEQKQRFRSRIPTDAPPMRTRYLANVVDENVGAAQKHLQVLYESGLEVGPGFSAVEKHAGHVKYAFWLQGIERHLKMCEAVLAEQPGAG